MRLIILMFMLYTYPVFAGGWAFHMKSAERAVDLLPQGDLKSLLSANITPVVNGAKYPDGGFTTGDHEASDWLHKDVFFNALFRELEEKDCTDFSAPDCRKKLAFAFGCIAHEVGDVNFDRYFLTAVADADFGGNLSTAQNFTDKRFDAVIIKAYKMEDWVPKLYHPVDLVHRAFESSQINVSKKTLRMMQLMQVLQYSVLTSYAKIAANRIAQTSQQARQSFMYGPGGVEDTAEKIGRLWLDAWQVIENSEGQKLPRLKTWGQWPYNNIRVIE